MAIVFLRIRTTNDPSNSSPVKSVGFLVSRDGYVVTAADVPIPDGGVLVGYVGDASSVGHDLQLVAKNSATDIALWKIEQSRNCRQILPLSSTLPERGASLVMLGLSGDHVNAINLTVGNVSQNAVDIVGSVRETDGAIFSGAPVLNGDGAVVGRWKAWTSSSVAAIMPTGPLADMLKANGVKFSSGEAIGFDETCYALCRVPSHGVESWAREIPWSAQSGWLGGGHNQRDECAKLRAGSVLTSSAPQLDIQITKTWESSKKDLLGHVEYNYFCAGVARSGPIYKEARSAECDLFSPNGD